MRAEWWAHKDSSAMPVKPGETWATMLDDIALDGIRLRFE